MSAQYFTLPSVTLGSRESLTILAPDASMTEADRLTGLSILLSTVRQMNSPGLQLVGLTLSCFSFGVTEFATHLSTMTSLSVTLVSVTGENLVTVIEGDAHTLPGIRDIFLGTAVDPDCVEVSMPEGIYAALSSLLFAVGKQAGTGPEANAVKSRPGALIRRFTIPEDQQTLMPGKALGPSQQALEKVYNAFSTYTEPRMKLVQLFLSVSTMEGHPAKHIEVLLTNFRMMRGAGMTHVGAILSLAQMHPWTLRVPELGPYYSRFVAETAKFDTIPVSVRQYHRLLVPQSEFLFLTTDYKPLIAVAGDFIKDVEATFKGYVYGEQEFAKLIARVRSYEPSKSKFIGKGSLAAALGVPDMELPPHPDQDKVVDAEIS